MASPTKDDSMDTSAAGADKTNLKGTKSSSALTKMLAQLAHDEFEEFEALPTDAGSFGTLAHGEALNVWEDNWDDESTETDFSKQLKEELAKHGHNATQK